MEEKKEISGTERLHIGQIQSCISVHVFLFRSHPLIPNSAFESTVYNAIRLFPIRKTRINPFAPNV